MQAETLFSEYSEQLKFLKNNGYLKSTILRHENTYIYPICLKKFSQNDLNIKLPNQLTREHAPPKLVGGDIVALLCKQCNSNACSNYDNHLGERLLDIDKNEGRPGVEVRGSFVHPTGGSIHAVLSIDKDGIIKTRFNSKINNPIIFNKFRDELLKKSRFNFEAYYKSDSRRLEISILKAAYILLFSRFGYWFILDDVYAKLRQQLLNPKLKIYLKGFVVDRIGDELPDGIHIIENDLAEGFIVVFTALSVIGTKHRYRVLLPIPMSLPDKSVSIFLMLLEKIFKLFRQKQTY